jgi:NAD(P)-dependent dehydrogenase (short-subunit alcohol dehydrogenase family)
MPSPSNGPTPAKISSPSPRLPGLHRRLPALAGLVVLPALIAAPGPSSPPGPTEPTAPPRAESPAGRATSASAAPRVILVTGSTDGLGRAVALELAATGAHLIVHGRNRQRGLEVVAEIERRGTGGARFYAADFSSLDEVRRLAEAILADYDRLDVLVNNAGIWGREREVSADGHELHFAVNYLAGFLLTRLLLPRIVDSAPSRIVNVASAAQAPIDFDDVMLEKGYSDFRAYSQSKLGQVMFTIDLAEELAGAGVSVTALHPASMMDTPMVLSRGARHRSSVGEGARAVVHLVTAPVVESGQYFDGLDPERAHPQAYDEAARQRLRELSRRLTGLAPR